MQIYGRFDLEYLIITWKVHWIYHRMLPLFSFALIYAAYRKLLLILGVIATCTLSLNTRFYQRPLCFLSTCKCRAGHFFEISLKFNGKIDGMYFFPVYSWNTKSSNDCLKEEILIIFIYLLSHIPVAKYYK